MSSKDIDIGFEEGPEYTTWYEYEVTHQGKRVTITSSYDLPSYKLLNSTKQVELIRKYNLPTGELP